MSWNNILNRHRRTFFYWSTLVLSIGLLCAVGFFNVRCGNPNPPGGGPKDSIPPQLMGMSAPNRAVNFDDQKLIFYFTENIQVKEVKKIIVNPQNPKNKPDIYTYQNRLYFVWKNPLQRNTTYSINIGKNVTDLNENNAILSPIYFVFSTGKSLDSNTVYGRVIDAKTGKADSTMLVILHKSMDDSAVFNLNPDYVGTLDSIGRFTIYNIRDGNYKIYAVKDPVGVGRYVSQTQLFAYQEQEIGMAKGEVLRIPTMYAFAKDKLEIKKNAVKDSLVLTSLIKKEVTVYDSLMLSIAPVPTVLDTNKITLIVDSVPVKKVKLKTIIAPDSAWLRIVIDYKIPTQKAEFVLAMDSTIALNGVGRAISNKVDTVRFSSVALKKYGSLRIEHNVENYDDNYFVINIRDKKTQSIVMSVPLIKEVIEIPYILAGEYIADILNDKNKNGQWDAGSFFVKKTQPEISLSLKEEIAILPEEETTYVIEVGEGDL